VRAAYLVYAVALLLAAVAPTIGIFLVSRGLQGTANAFTTPLLLAGLADAVPAGERGRAVGMFAGVQAGGLSLAPLLGGLAAEGSWRGIHPAHGVAGVDADASPTRSAVEQPPTLRSVATPRMGRCAPPGCGLPGWLPDLAARGRRVRGGRHRRAVLAVYGAAAAVGRWAGLGWSGWARPGRRCWRRSARHHGRPARHRPSVGAGAAWLRQARCRRSRRR
jgi:hypothetical protein